MKKTILVLIFVVLASALLIKAPSLLFGWGIKCNCYDGYCMNLQYVRCDVFCATKDGKGWQQSGNFCYAVEAEMTECRHGEYCELMQVTFYCKDGSWINKDASCSEECPGCDNYL